MLAGAVVRSEEHTSELQSHEHLVCRLLLEKKKTHSPTTHVAPHTGTLALPRHSTTLDGSYVTSSAAGVRLPSKPVPRSGSFFFFNDTATTEIYTLSLHDALPISSPRPLRPPRQGRATRSRTSRR